MTSADNKRIQAENKIIMQCFSEVRTVGEMLRWGSEPTEPTKTAPTEQPKDESSKPVLGKRLVEETTEVQTTGKKKAVGEVAPEPGTIPVVLLPRTFAKFGPDDLIDRDLAPTMLFGSRRLDKFQTALMEAKIALVRTWFTADELDSLFAPFPLVVVDKAVGGGAPTGECAYFKRSCVEDAYHYIADAEGVVYVGAGDVMPLETTKPHTVCLARIKC